MKGNKDRKQGGTKDAIVAQRFTSGIASATNMFSVARVLLYSYKYT
jgi:hypothetical protein